MTSLTTEVSLNTLLLQVAKLDYFCRIL